MNFHETMHAEVELAGEKLSVGYAQTGPSCGAAVVVL